MTATAWWRMSSFVWGFSLFRCIWHIRPSSLKASLMSRTLRRSRALLAILLSRSRSAFCSGFRSSSSVRLWREHSFTAGAGVCNSHIQRSTLNMNLKVSNSLSHVECLEIYSVFVPCARACSGCPHIFVTVVIRHVVCGEVVGHVVLVWFFHFQFQVGRHLPG